MGLNLTALGLKFASGWLVLLLAGPYWGGYGASKAAWVALALGVVSLAADKLFPFGMQGITRWAIDGGLAAITIYLVQVLFTGPNINFLTALLAGLTIGAVEIPLHFLLATWFGLGSRDRRRNDSR